MAKFPFLRLCVFTICFQFFCHSAESQELRIGMVSDEASVDRLQPILLRMQTEIQKTVGSSRKVVFDASNVISINYDLSKGKSAYRELEAKTDLILLLGSVSIRSALELPSFSVPTFGLGVFDTKLQSVPLTPAGTSGRKNFSYILTSEDLEEDLGIFKEMVDFKKVALLFSGGAQVGLGSEGAVNSVKEIEKNQEIEIEFVPVSKNDIPGSLAKLSPETEAVFLVIPYELSPEDAKTLAEELVKRKLPSFSINKSYVNQGILASNSPDNGLEQLLRKLSIMVDDAVQNQPLEDMKVNLDLNKELFLNMVTARSIEYSPPFELIFTANLLGNEEDLDRTTYSLMDIIQQGLDQNLNIKISEADIALTEQDVRTAVSQFLPDVDYSATGVMINGENANALLMRSQYSLSGSGTFSQLIYSEQALANIRIQKLLKQAQEYATEQQILDITQDIINAYLNILNAKASVQIQNENLEKSRANLELAEIRAKLGAATNADVFRWKGELASAKQSVVEAQTNLLTIKAQLNAFLNDGLGMEYDVEDVLIDGALFQAFSASELGSYVKGPYELELITEFLIEESKANYPNKKQLTSNMGALDRQRTLNKRLYFTPTVAASATLDNTFWRGGEGSEPAQGMEFVNSSWNIGLNVSIPLFDGNRRAINLQTTKIQQAQLRDQIDNLDRNLEFSVRANTLQLLSASTNINFSKESADNTDQNYKLVQNLYKKGQVNIIQLLDAQTAALNAKLAYALSVYEYVQAFIQLENSIGSYSLISTPERNQSFLDRWEQFLENKQQEDPK